MSNIFDRMASPNEPPAERPGVAKRLDHAHAPQVDVDTKEEVTEGAVRTSADVKSVTQELLKHGYIEEARKPEFFRRAIVHENEIMAVLEPLDLVLSLDTHRGVAFLAIAQAVQEHTEDGAGWSHPLVRRQRLTLEQSLLVAILRQAFVIHEQETGVGQAAAKIAVDDLLPQFLTYFDDTGSDAKNESRLTNLLDQLKTYGIVSEVDKKQEVTIRPMIAHLANPESLSALLRVLEEQSTRTDASEYEAHA